MGASPLAHLPAELRNTVYELIFTHTNPIQFRWIFYRHAAVHRHASRYAGSAAGIFYAVNDFVMTYKYGDMSTDQIRLLPALQSLVDAIRVENAQIARSITLRTMGGRGSLPDPAALTMEQLYPWCKQMKLPRRVAVDQGMLLELDMLDQRRSCDKVVRQLEELIAPGGRL